MRQRVVATLNTSDFRTFKLKSVHEVNGKLIVIAEVKHRGGFGHGDLDDYSVSANVKTSSKDNLEVVYYLTGLSQEELDANAYRLESQPTKFIPLVDINSIQELLAHGKELYSERSGKQKGIRTGQHARKRLGTCTMVSNVSPAESVNVTAMTCKNFLNIYTLADEGEFKLVLESIQKHNEPDMLEQHLHHRSRDRGPSFNEFEDRFFQETDDCIYFNGSVGGEAGLYKSTAYEFTLPENNVSHCMRILNWLDHLLKNSDQKTTFSHVQFGRDSVLSQCGELLISKASMEATHEDAYRVEYPTPLALDEFVRASQPVNNDSTASKAIGQALIGAENLPGYRQVQRTLKQITNNATNLAVKPVEVLNMALGEDVRALRDMKRSLAERLEMATRMEEKMMQDGNLETFASFLPAIQDSFVEHFIAQVIGKPAADGGKYNSNYTEFSFLKDAKFQLKADGRICLTHENNSGYDQYYAAHARNHAIFEAEMRFLGKMDGVELEFEDGCDFHKEIIFTPACSQRLRALGVLLNERSLREQLALSQLAAPALLSATPGVALELVSPVQEETISDLLQSETMQVFIKQFPELETIISMLQTANVFGADMEHNRFLIANLIHACVEVTKKPDNAKETQSRDTLADLVELHRVLLANDDHPCLLTAKLHQAIVGNIAVAKKLANTLEVLAHAGKLDAALAGKIYTQAIYVDNIRAQVSAFDETLDSVMYMLNKVEHPGELVSIWDIFAMVSMPMLSRFKSSSSFGLGFMNKEDFKYLMDHLHDNFSSILDIMRSLSDDSVLVGYRQRVFAYAEANNCHRELRTTLGDLNHADALNAEMLEHVLAGVDSKSVLALAKLQKGNTYLDYKDYVLAHPECCEAISALGYKKLLNKASMAYLAAGVSPDSIIALDLLEKANLLSVHKDLLLANQAFGKMIQDLHDRKLLNDTTVRYTMNGAAAPTVTAMHHLDQAGLLNQHSDYVLSHPEMAEMTILLGKLGVLTAENFNLARDHRLEFSANVDMFDKLSLFGYWGSYYKTDDERKAVMIALLTNRELCAAITIVREIVLKKLGIEEEIFGHANNRQNNISFYEVGKLFNSDIVKLLTAAGIAPPASSEAKPNNNAKNDDHPVAAALNNLVKTGLALFKPKQKTLAEVLQEFKAKFNYQDGVVEHQVAIALK